MNDQKLENLKNSLDEVLGDKEEQRLLEVLFEAKKQVTYLKELRDLVSENNTKYLNQTDLLVEINKKISEMKLVFPEVQVVKLLEKINFPDSINITNLPDFPKSIEISNFPKQKDFPEEIKISNIEDLKNTDPISLKKPDWLDVLTKEDIENVIYYTLKKVLKVGIKSDLDDYRDARKPIAVRLSDGKRFYEAFFQSVSSGGAFPFEDIHGRAKAPLVGPDGQLYTELSGDTATSTNQTNGLQISRTDSLFKTNHIDNTTTTDVTYIGKETKSGTYQVSKVDETGSFPVITYAFITNNPSITTYDDAWSNRLTLTYETYADAS